MPKEYDSFDSKQKRKFWENHIKQWEAGGQSQRAYCRKHDLIINRFYDWKRRITAKDKSHVSFLPVALSDSPAKPHLLEWLLAGLDYTSAHECLKYRFAS